MIIVIAFLLALTAFLLGFVFGTLFVPAVKTVKTVKPERSEPELEKLKKEYENFLSYDGSEQP
mgnify:FL=1